jgi:hypothetical protein
MSRVAAATIVDKSGLALARVLAASFLEHHRDVPFFVLLADEVDGYFDPAKESFELVTLDQLKIPELRRFLFHYSRQEVSYAATPFLLHHLLERGFDGAIFLKQESLVTAPFYDVLQRAAASSILLTPHLLGPLEGEGRFRRELNILQSGVYNGGFVGVAATTEGRDFLEWWKDLCFRHCVHDVPNGVHFEQRWLDFVPAYFEDYEVITDVGFNVGHWNLLERHVAIEGDAITVNGRPCRYVRFSGFDPEKPERVTRYLPLPTMADIGEGARLFQLYAGRLRNAGYEESSRWPYAFSKYEDGVPVSYDARKLYRELGDSVERLPDPWSAEYRRWYAAYEREHNSFMALLRRARKVWKTQRAERGMLAAIRVVVVATWRYFTVMMHKRVAPRGT